MWNFGQSSDDEALRLLAAFLKINEPERRREIVELAERYHRITVHPLTKLPQLRQDNAPAVNPPFADKK